MNREQEEIFRRSFRSIYINELLSGQSKEYIEHVCKTGDVHFSFDENNAYLCLTGLEKYIYTGRCGLKTKEYMALFLLFRERLLRFFEEIHCKGEIVLILYFNSKRICIIFSPMPACTLAAQEIAERVNTMLQETYKSDSRLDAYKNNISLSPHMQGFAEIAPTFARLLEIHKQAWFVPEIGLFTAETEMELRRPMSNRESGVYTAKINHALNENDWALCEEVLRELMLDRLKYTFDMSLCWDVLHELRRIYQKYGETYDYPTDGAENEVFKPSRYLHLQECHETVQKTFEALGAHLSQVGEPKSYLTLEALQYIRNNYTGDIAVTDIAKYLGIVPTYLSRIFNKDMHTSIPAYLNDVRMERAQVLLCESEKKIGDIALAVGIYDRANFIRKFKQCTGLTPSEFREQKKEG